MRKSLSIIQWNVIQTRFIWDCWTSKDLMRQSLSCSLFISTIRIETGLNANNHEFCFQKWRSLNYSDFRLFIIKNLYLMMSHHALNYDITDEISCLTSQVKKSDFWILFPKMKAGDIPFTVTNFFNDFNLNWFKII